MRIGYLGQVGLVMLGYYVAGRLALLLAIPPGYATAVWPAAGIALAAMLVWGYRIWPGILLGSFLLNAWTGVDPTNAATLIRSLSIGASIGVGAALQALGGTYLVRRYVGYPLPLDDVRSIVQFMGLGGVVGCVINATWGVATLWLSGSIVTSGVAFSWATWWVGDTIGVLIFAPMGLILLGAPRALWRARRFSVGGPLLITFTLVVAFFLFTSEKEEERLRLAFESQAHSYADDLSQNYNSYLEALYAIERFFAGSDTVTHDEFQWYVARMLARHDGIQALEWVPHVPAAERPAYEAAARRVGPEGFVFAEQDTAGVLIPRTPQDVYFPVYYVAPLAGNEAALGYDLSSSPARRAALLEAQDTGQAVATGRIALVQEQVSQFGVLVFLPVYEAGVAGETEAARRARLKGFALGVFRIDAVLGDRLSELNAQGIMFRLSDLTAPAGEQLLAVNGAAWEGRLGAEDGLDTQRRMAYTTTMEVAGRVWQLDLVPAPSYFLDKQTLTPWVVLAGGLLVTALLGAFLLLVSGHTAQVERMVEQRTAELLEANTSLQHEIARRERLEEAQQQANQELAVLNKVLAQSNEELKQFAYVASHDLQEPLRTISSFIELLRKKYQGQLSEEADDYIDFVVDAAHRMQVLIKDVLSYSRIGRSARPPRRIDMNETVADVLLNLQTVIAETEAEVVVGPLPTLMADETQLSMVFQNLISNALKFRGTASLQIQVEATQLADEWRFAVRDNGLGIPVEQHKRIFEVFKRLHSRVAYAGTGIGLAICKKVVEGHGGRIWVASEVGEGTTFFFTLPAVASESATLAS